MKPNKLNLMLYINNGSLTRILYLIASLIIFIPICIVLVTDTSFSSSFSGVSIILAYVLVIIGKFLTIFRNKKENKSISVDVGIITGILFAFISHILN